jgi:hypothetical protein
LNPLQTHEVGQPTEPTKLAAVGSNPFRGFLEVNLTEGPTKFSGLLEPTPLAAPVKRIAARKVGSGPESFQSGHLDFWV